MDLDVITDDWPYDEDNDAANVRKVKGIDGRMKIQVRLRNGLVQWEAAGRPDGCTPYGCATLLEHCRRRMARQDCETAELPEQLVEEVSLELFDYYKRSQALFHLGDYEGARADVCHCLRVLGMLRRCTYDDGDWLDQYRPRLLMDRARAEMLLEVRRGDVRKALEALNSGIDGLEEYYLEHELDERLEDSVEKQILIELRRSLRERHQVPLSDRELLRSLRLEQEVAVRKENYEMAARLRDKINSLKEKIRARD